MFLHLHRAPPAENRLNMLSLMYLLMTGRNASRHARSTMVSCRMSSSMLPFEKKSKKMKDGYTIKGNQTWHVAVSAKAPGARRGPRTRSRFPAGRTDDIADAMGLLGRLLDKMFGASIPTVKEKTIDDYHDMQGFSYPDDGLGGEDTWRTI